MLKELKELLQVLYSIKESKCSSLVYNQYDKIENKIVALESAIEILEERRKQSE